MIHLGDITKIKGNEAPVVDVITGGSPCQDLSVAGKRAGLAGERSGLFMEQIRIIKEMRNVLSDDNRGMDKPRFMVWENVYGAFSSNKGEDFRAVLEETAKVKDKNASIPRPSDGKWQPCGVILGDGYSLAWRGHDAQYWGVPQRRKRICLLADFEGDAAPRILFESELWRMSDQGEPYEVITDFGAESGQEVQPLSESMSGNTEQSRETGKDITSNTEGSSGTAISFQERAGKPGGGKGILIQNEHIGALSTLNNQSVCYGISSYDSNAMKSSNPQSGIYEADTSRTLDLNGGSPACNQGGMAVVCLEGNGTRESHKGDGYKKSETMYTLNTVEQHAVCTEIKASVYSTKRHNHKELGEVCECLEAHYGTGGGNTPLVATNINGNEVSNTLISSMSTPVESTQDALCILETYQNVTGSLMASGYNKLGTQEAMNDMFVVSSSWDGSQVSPTLTANNADGSQRMPDKENFNAVIGFTTEMTPKVDEKGVGFSLRSRDYKDPQAVISFGLDRASYNQGQNAKFDFSVEQERIGPQTAMGPGAVCETYQNVTGTLDCGIAKGTQNQLANQDMFIANMSVVRRLTPKECLRLQGYPDGWYDIGEWTDSKGKKHKEADAPKYKAAGNSIALPFWKWLAKRICAEYDRPVKMASLFDGIGGFPLSFSEAGAVPVWASEIEEFPIAVTKARFGGE